MENAGTRITPNMKNRKSNSERMYDSVQSTRANINNYFRKSGLVPKSTISLRIYHVKVISCGFSAMGSRK